LHVVFQVPTLALEFMKDALRDGAMYTLSIEAESGTPRRAPPRKRSGFLRGLSYLKREIEITKRDGDFATIKKWRSFMLIQ